MAQLSTLGVRATRLEFMDTNTKLLKEISDNTELTMAHLNEVGGVQTSLDEISKTLFRIEELLEKAIGAKKDK